MDNKELYNYSLKMTLLALLICVFLSMAFLGIYYSTHKYTYVDYDDHKFAVPMGYNHKIMEQNVNYLFIYNDAIGYDIRVLHSSINQYKNNNFEGVEKTLIKNNYIKDFIKEMTYHDRSAIVSRFTTQDNEKYYFYMYDLSDEPETIYGYIYQDEVSDEEFNTLFDILERTK